MPAAPAAERSPAAEHPSAAARATAAVEPPSLPLLLLEHLLVSRLLLEEHLLLSMSVHLLLLLEEHLLDLRVRGCRRRIHALCLFFSERRAWLSPADLAMGRRHAVASKPR